MTLTDLVGKHAPILAEDIAKDPRYARIADQDMLASNIEDYMLNNRTWNGMACLTDVYHVTVRKEYTSAGCRPKLKLAPRCRSHFNMDSRNLGRTVFREWTVHKEFEAASPLHRVKFKLVGCMVYDNAYRESEGCRHRNPVTMWLNNVDRPMAVVHRYVTMGREDVDNLLLSRKDQPDFWEDHRTAAAVWELYGRGVAGSDLQQLLGGLRRDRKASPEKRREAELERNGLLMDALSHDTWEVSAPWVRRNMERDGEWRHGTLRWLWFDGKLRERALNRQKCAMVGLAL